MSKWKKIGSVHSGDDFKSNRSFRSRSKDEMPTQSFRQNVARMNTNSLEFIDSQNTYFCQNYIDKKNNTFSNRSLSRIKTQKSLTHFRQDVMRSTLSKKRISKDDDNQSLYSGADRIEKSQPKKLKQFAKQSQIKALKQDHLRLKEYVKFEINSFKAAFKDLSAELKFQINYRKGVSAQKSKAQNKSPTLVPIVPYRFDSKILENINFDGANKKGSSKGQHADINVLNQIKTEVRLCIDSLNEYDNEKAQILDKYKDINLEELLA